MREVRAFCVRTFWLFSRCNFIKEVLFISREKDTVQLNEQIRDKELRIVSADGEQLGIMSARDAQKIADDRGLDLVKIAPQAKPPVCKIMDYSKYRYEQAKREKENRKNQKTVETKEIRLSLKIDIGLQHQAQPCQEVLRGRQQAEGIYPPARAGDGPL